MTQDEINFDTSKHRCLVNSRFKLHVFMSIYFIYASINSHINRDVVLRQLFTNHVRVCTIYVCSSVGSYLYFKLSQRLYGAFLQLCIRKTKNL